MTIYVIKEVNYIQYGFRLFKINLNCNFNKLNYYI